MIIDMDLPSFSVTTPSPVHWLQYSNTQKHTCRPEHIAEHSYYPSGVLMREEVVTAEGQSKDGV